MTDPETFRPLQDDEQQNQQGGFQIDGYAVKPVGSGAEKPKTWREVASRLNHILMRIVLAPVELVAVVFESSADLVRGCGHLPTAMAERVAGAHHQVDEREAKKQAKMTTGELPASEVDDARGRLESQLQHKQEQGHHVEIRDLGDGRVAIIVVQEGQAELTDELLKQGLPWLPPDEIDASGTPSDDVE